MGKELEALEKVYYGSQGYGNCDENYKIVKQSLHRLESIDNAEPSEALEDLQVIENNIIYLLSDCDTNDEVEQCLKDTKAKISTIKQALLKAQEPKHYLKWEDLEFRNEEQTMKVKMGDTNYLLTLRIGLTDVKSVVLRDNNLKPFLHLFEKEKQFFNDLHLERVEE